MAQLRLERNGRQITASLEGELDHHSAGVLREQIDTAVLRCRCLRLEIDLSGLTFMDSSGIGLIMGRYRLVHSMGGQVVLVGISDRMKTILFLAGLDKLPLWGNEATGTKNG